MFCTLGIVPKIKFYLKADVQGLRFLIEKLKNPRKNCIELYVFSDSFDTDWSILLSIHKKNSLGLCAVNFDATDLPHSSFEWLCPKDFRGSPDIDLVSIIWRPAPSKVMISQKLSETLGHFEAVFLTEMIFLAKRSMFAYFIMHVCKAKIGIFGKTQWD